MAEESFLIVAARGSVIAYQRETGAEVWRFAYHLQLWGLDALYRGPVELAIHGARVYVAMRDVIVCLDYATGAEVGRVMLPKPSTQVTFIIEGDRMFLTVSDRVMCLALDGQVLWETPHGLHLVSGAAIGVPGNVRQGDEIKD